MTNKTKGEPVHSLSTAQARDEDFPVKIAELGSWQ
jgi:hypothetical protein